MNHSNNKIILSFIIFMIIFLVILSAFLQGGSYISYMMVYLILPSIIALGIDRSTDKCLFISTGFFNLGGILLSIAKLSGDTNNIMNPLIFKSIYIISFMGYVFYHFIPPIIQLFYSYIAKLNKVRSQNKIKLIKELWDITSY